MGYLYATLIGLGAFAIRLWARNLSFNMPSDSFTYSRMSFGEAVPNPFRIRWLIPKMFGRYGHLWLIVAPVALLGTCPLIYWFGNLHGISSLWLVALWVALPLWDILSAHAGIVDQFSWVFALAVACLSLAGYFWFAIGLVMVAAAVAPKTVVFAALWSLNPWLLLGLIPAGIAYWKAPKGEPVMHADIINHPWKSAMEKNGMFLHDAKALLMPWGACLFGLATIPLIHVVTVAVAYAQMFCAIDRARLYMWAAPVLLVATVTAIPGEWLPIAFFVTWFNPWRSIV